VIAEGSHHTVSLLTRNQMMLAPKASAVLEYRTLHECSPAVFSSGDALTAYSETCTFSPSQQHPCRTLSQLM